MSSAMLAQTGIPGRYVGFDQYMKQVEQRWLRHGFRFNVMIVGNSGLGKSTFVNTMFATKLQETIRPVEKTTTIKTSSILLEENKVKMMLTLIDTPGFNEGVDNSTCLDPIMNYIDQQNRNYLHNEFTNLQSRANDGCMGYDTRVHLVLYFIAPECVRRGLTDMDLMALRAMGQVACLIPVIAKSDTLTLEERQEAKLKIKQVLEKENVRYFPYELTMDQMSGIPLAADEERYLDQVKALVPFCVMGGDQVVGMVNVNGVQKSVRGRKMRGGAVVDVEDPTHSDTPALIHFVTRTHLADILDTTSYIHYQAFRNKMLAAVSFASIMGDIKLPTVPSVSHGLETEDMVNIPMPTVAAPQAAPMEVPAPLVSLPSTVAAQ